MPSSSCHKASDAFSISSNSKKLSFSLSVWLLASSSWVIKGCVSRWPKYPGGEPINLAISCECGNSAVHLDHRARVSKQDFRRGFHDACLAGAGRSQEQEIPHRTTRRVQSRAEDLVQVHQRLHAFRLSDDLRAQRRLKFNRRVASQIWIEWQYLGAHGLLLAAMHPHGRIAETSALPVKLAEFHLKCGLQKPKLH